MMHARNIDFFVQMASPAAATGDAGWLAAAMEEAGRGMSELAGESEEEAQQDNENESIQSSSLRSVVDGDDCGGEGGVASERAAQKQEDDRGGRSDATRAAVGNGKATEDEGNGGDASELAATPTWSIADLIKPGLLVPASWMCKHERQATGVSDRAGSHTLRRLGRAEFEEEFGHLKGGYLGMGTEGRVEAYLEKSSGELVAVKWCPKVAQRDIEILEKLSRTDIVGRVAGR